MASFLADPNVGPQGQNGAEEGDGPFQEAGAGRPTAGPQNQRQLCVRLHRRSGWQAALLRDLSGEHLNHGLVLM